MTEQLLLVISYFLILVGVVMSFAWHGIDAPNVIASAGTAVLGWILFWPR